MVFEMCDYKYSYPPGENWCNLLLKEHIREPKVFCCHGYTGKEGLRYNDIIGQSCYALNINVADKKCSDIPPDTVLLFETTAGVNPVGGPEMLTTDNHQSKGCHVCFADGSVKFVETKEVSNLRWTIDDVNNSSVKDGPNDIK